MTEIITLEYGDSTLRVVKDGGDPYWVVKDVANVLGYAEPHNASRGISTHTVTIPTNGGRQPVATVNEVNLWKIIYRGERTNRPGLKEFKEWVTSVAMGILSEEATA